MIILMVIEGGINPCFPQEEGLRTSPFARLISTYACKAEGEGAVCAVISSYVTLHFLQQELITVWLEQTGYKMLSGDAGRRGSQRLW